MTLTGGVPYDAQVFGEATLRAELCELAQNYCIKHGTAVVDAVLRNYHVTSKLARRGRP